MKVDYEQEPLIRSISMKLFRIFEPILYEEKMFDIRSDWVDWQNDGDILVLANQVLEEDE